MLDLDLLFRADIRELYSYFDSFTPNTIMALAHDHQPVYRHILSLYRMHHSGTNLGEAYPVGFPGYNSGVKLMDLDNMRKSEPYALTFSTNIVDVLTSRYHFRGHLGDQDLYTLLAIERPELFLSLPCQWNKQMCTWWKDHGYEQVFDSYFNCSEPIKIYHGNCNTPLPSE